MAQRVGDGARLREGVVSQQHTHAIGVGSAGMAGDGIQLRASILVAVEAGFEHRFHGAHAQITKQWGIVHPIQAGVAVAAVNGFTARRKHERVSLAPVKNLTAGFSLPMASGHEEQLTGRIRMGAQGSMIQSDEVAAERWTGGRTFAVQVGTQIKRLQGRSGLIKKTGRKAAVGDRADQPLLQGIGC